jgi:beta-N-acetylhexosaminidase
VSTTLELSELDAKIGQLFMIGLPGPEMDQETEALIRDHNPGGVILFSRNIEDPVQIARLCRDLQKTAKDSEGFPLFLAVDQEGGRVARLKEPFTTFPGNAAIGGATDPAGEAEEFARVTAEEMKLVGLNMDMAPVVDVQRGELEKHLVGRTFGEDPETVARLGATVIRTMQMEGIMAVAKHFPGLGLASIDPHFELPKIDASLEEIEGVNLPPFKAAIDEGVSAIMTSHAVYPALDSNRPATLSPAALIDLLRKKMGFEGLIISDDLEMGAIAKTWGVAEGTAEAFAAGSDVLLICKDQEYFLEGIGLIRGRLLQGRIPFQRLQESYGRIKEAKTRFLQKQGRVVLAEVRRHFKLSA